MTEPEVSVLADRALLRVVEQIRDDQWETILPDWFQHSQPDKNVPLRETIAYHAYDDAWVPDMLAGKTMDEAGKDKFDGDLLADDPKGNFRAIVEKSIAAAEHVEDLNQTVHASFGDFTTQQYLWQINMFRGVRAYDLAKLIGVDPTLEPTLVEGLWEELTPNAAEWRKIGVLPEPITVPEDAPLLDRMLGLTGRQP